MHGTREHLTPIRRIGTGEWLTAPAAVAARAVTRFATAARPLPSLFRTPMVDHALSPRIPAPAGLQRLVRRLRGRLVVVNPVGAAKLPATLTSALSATVRQALDTGIGGSDAPATTGLDPRASSTTAAPRGAAAARAHREHRLSRELLRSVAPATRERLAARAKSVGLALYETTAPLVTLVPGGGTGGRDEQERRAQTIVHFDYRVALVVVTGDEVPAWSDIDAAVAQAPAASWPPGAEGPPWFVGELLVPDAWLAACADTSTLARWAHVTGRAGARDDYWFPESWERFLEGGRPAGCVTPADVWRRRRGRVLGASRSSAAADESPWAGGAPRLSGMAMTPDVERGLCVPPGYALARCVGTLGVTVVAI